MHESASPVASTSDAASDPPGGFGGLLVVRSLTVIDDNLLRWLAIGLGKHAAGAAGTALVLTVGTAGFVLPFVALAWLAGWIADRHPKRSVIAWCKFAEVIIVAAAVVVLWWGSHPGGAFDGWGRFIPAAGWLLVVASAGWLASLRLARHPAADPAAAPPFNALARTWSDLMELGRSRELLAAAAGIVFFWALGAVAQLNVDQLVSEGGAKAQSQAIPMLLSLVIGIALGSVVAGRVSSRGADLGLVPLGGLLMAAASLALATGPRTMFVEGAALPGPWWTVVAALGVLGFGAGMFDVPLEAHFQAVAPPARRGALLAALNLLTFAGMLGASLVYGLLRAPADQPAAPLPPALWLLLGTVILIGCQAALLAPALVGSIAETVPQRRLADANGTFAMVTLAATLTGMAGGNWLADQPAPAATEAAAVATPLVSARGVFGIFAALSLVAAVVATYAAPRATLRLAVNSLVNAIWRFRVVDADRMPPAGPVVVVANHISWLDGFVVVLSASRPVRLVVYGPNIQGRLLRALAAQWRFILFDPRPKSIARALGTIQSGLADGDAIGIFCEGGISRTGQILGFKRGLEWLLARVQAPIITLSIDGMWGSGLSFSEGRFFTKWPRLWRRPLTLTYGPVLPVGTHPDEARLALQEVAAAAVHRRMNATRSATRDLATWRRRHGQASVVIDAEGRAAPVSWPAGAPSRDWPAFAATAEAFDGACLIRRDDRLFSSLAPGDPLYESLGTFGGPLLGIRAAVAAPELVARPLAESLVREGSTIWLARLDQVLSVASLAADGGPALAGLAAVVIPIATAGDLPRACEAIEAFRQAVGLEPVVAYAPAGTGGLVAMNTPPARAPVGHEVTCKADTLGRVLNGVVVWPRAAERDRLGLAPVAAQGIPVGATQPLVIGATLTAGTGEGLAPGATLLAEALTVDSDGFLVAQH